jgi:Holliday junction resolvase
VKLKKRANRSKLGRRSKNKGSNYERQIEKDFEKWSGAEWVRTPSSGGFAKNKQTAESFRGDIVPADRTKITAIHIECKNQKTWALPAWLKQAQTDTENNGKTPLLVFHKYGTSDDYVCLRLRDLFALVPPENIFKESSTI